MPLKPVRLFVGHLFGFLILVSGYECIGETLINFKEGTKTKAEDLLGQGNALVYIERGCSICHQYVQSLATCKESIKEKLQIVSISTPAQTKEMSFLIPPGLALYMVKDQKAAKSVYATPTTLVAQGQKVGILKCDELEKFISINQK